MKGLDWIMEVHIGGIYKYEESYHLQAKVKIEKKEVLFGGEYGNGYVRFTVKVIEAFTGCEIDEEFTVGKSLFKEGAYLVSGMKFKDVENGMFDYMGMRQQ